jgi:Zn finger protein HypA/HybF involved in hydrogenase expression
MGRRPNQLILEYFERGPKLEDASNRYQHTCKSCGEKVRTNNPAVQCEKSHGAVKVRTEDG